MAAGPPGVYGRSAIGGTVNVAFKRPEFENGGNATLEVGNYDLIHGTVVGNAMLSEQLALRIGLDYAYRDGYMETGSDSQDDISGRIGLRDAGGNLQFVFDENAFLRDRPWDDLRPGVLAETAPFGQPTPSTQNYENYATGLQIDAELSDTVSLTNITGYVYLDAETEVYWLGVLPAYKLDKYRMLSNELRLTGDTDKLKWLVGLFAYRNKGVGQATASTSRRVRRSISVRATALPSARFPRRSASRSATSPTFMAGASSAAAALRPCRDGARSPRSPPISSDSGLSLAVAAPDRRRVAPHSTTFFG